MKRNKLLGLVGLALMAMATAVASILPGAQALAATEGSVGLKVVVGQPNVYVRINQVDGMMIADDSTSQVVVRKNLTVRIEYAHAKSVNVTLRDMGSVSVADSRLDTSKSTGKELTPAVSSCSSVEYADTVKYCEVTFELADEDIDHRFEIKALAREGEKTASDYYWIIYRAATLRDTGRYDENGNPIVEATINSAVKKADIYVYNAEGELVLGPIALDIRDGEEVYSQDIALKMKEAGLSYGTYTVVLAAYADAEGKDLVAMSVIEIVYGEAPDVPGTGTNSNLLRELNISRADYIITGLIAFGLVSMFAVFLIARRSRR